MCKPGDLILVEEYRHNGQVLDRHTFVVINSQSGQIEGFDYDLIGNVMSSFKSEEHRAKKLSYPGNVEIAHDKSTLFSGNARDGYTKADQLYFFKEELTKYRVIGYLDPVFFAELIGYVKNHLQKLTLIMENLV